MEPEEARLNELLTALRQRGCRITPQRVAICRTLAASRTHPTAHAIYEQARAECPAIGLKTVYNTVGVLLALGEIIEVGPRGWSRFETYPEPHVNLVCTVCGRIRDLPMPALDDLSRAIHASTGFAVQASRVDYYGVCALCQQTNGHDPHPVPLSHAAGEGARG